MSELHDILRTIAAHLPIPSENQRRELAERIDAHESADQPTGSTPAAASTPDDDPKKTTSADPTTTGQGKRDEQ